MDTYAPFAEIYEEWSAPMTEDIPFYVGAPEEADGPVVELAVGTGRVAVPVAQAIGRPMLGIDRSPAMLAKARKAGWTWRVWRSTCGKATCASSRSTSRRRSSTVPYRSLCICRRGRTAGGSSNVAESLKPGGRFAWNAFVFDPHIAVRMDGVARPTSTRRRSGSTSPTGRRTTGSTSPRTSASPGLIARPPAVVADAIRVGRADRRGRA